MKESEGIKESEGANKRVSIDQLAESDLYKVHYETELLINHYQNQLRVINSRIESIRSA